MPSFLLSSESMPTTDNCQCPAGNFLREGSLTINGCSDVLGSECRHLGALAQGSIPDRGCPSGSERLGSLGKTASFRQLAQSPKSGSAGTVEEQGETTGGGRGRSGSGGPSGEGGNAGDGRSSSFATVSREREVVNFALPLPCL